jgi:archaellum component FlaF (FlaF/FlaG flagellin family)
VVEEFGVSQKRPSKLYYLLPIFLGILGGVAAYLLVKDRDKKFAKKLLIVGIIMTVVFIVIRYSTSFILGMWLKGFTEEQTAEVATRSQSQIACSVGGISLSGINYCNGLLKGNVINTGTISLGNLTLQVLYSDQSIEKFNLQQQLKPTETYQFTINIKTNYDRVKIISNCTSVFDEVSSAEITKC